MKRSFAESFCSRAGLQNQRAIRPAPLTEALEAMPLLAAGQAEDCAGAKTGESPQCSAIEALCCLRSALVLATVPTGSSSINSCDAFGRGRIKIERVWNLDEWASGTA